MTSERAGARAPCSNVQTITSINKLLTIEGRYNYSTVNGIKRCRICFSLTFLISWTANASAVGFRCMANG
jgi:hypothetical protein